jgi:hypothetical protein
MARIVVKDNIMTYPIIYKTIPVQFAFMVHADGRLQIKMLSPMEVEKKFKTEKEAREFVDNLKEVL